MARVKRHIGMLLALALCVFAFHTAVQARAEPGNWHDSGVSCHHADTGTMRLAPMETHNWVFIRSQAPTCAVDGFRLYQCTYCSRQRTERLPAIGHNFAFTRTQTPTCTADGYRLYTCSNCGDTRRERISAIGHNFVFTRTQAPTCTADGYRLYTCSHCGDTRRERLPALGHDTAVTTQAPTCTADGHRHTTCTRCGETTTERLPALGHTFEETVTDPTCSADGLRTETCTRCGETHTERIPALGHDFAFRVQDPTCEEDGLRIETCVRCGYQQTWPGVGALGHDFGEWHTEEGLGSAYTDLEVRICATCGVHEARAVPADSFLRRTLWVIGGVEFNGMDAVASGVNVLQFAVFAFLLLPAIKLVLHERKTYRRFVEQQRAAAQEDQKYDFR